MQYLKALLVVAVTLCLLGCGPRPVPEYAGFETQVNTFISEGAARGVNVQLGALTVSLVDAFDSRVTNIEPNTVGVCIYTADYSTKDVEILRSYWTQLSNLTNMVYNGNSWINAGDAIKENLVFHELGHCLLQLQHTSCPNIMCPYVLDALTYEMGRAGFLDVLFMH